MARTSTMVNGFSRHEQTPFTSHWTTWPPAIDPKKQEALQKARVKARANTSPAPTPESIPAVEDSRAVCSNLSLSSSPPTETSCDVRGTPHGFRAADDGRTGLATTQTIPRYPHHLNSMDITAAPQVFPGWRPSTQSRPHASFFTVPTELSVPGRQAGCYSSDKFLAPVVITGLTKRGATANAVHSHLAPPARHRAAPFGGYGDFLCYERVDPNSGLVNPAPPACCASPLSSPSLPWTRSTRWVGPDPSKCLVLTRPTGAKACDSPQAVQVRSGNYMGVTSMISQKKGSECVTAISSFRGPQVSWLALAGRHAKHNAASTRW